MDLLFLKEKAKDVRNLIVDVVKNSGGGHLGSSLSSVELLTYLYFEELNINCDNLKSPTRDKFLLSKGHAGLALACVGVEKGFLTKEELFTFNKQNSTVSIHLDSKKHPFVDVSTGSLGHGEGIALGMALGYKKLGVNSKIYCMLGDGELNEGSVYEALSAVINFNATNLITIVDDNGFMLDGKTEDIMSVGALDKRLSAFGFEVFTCDGHDFEDIKNAFNGAKAAKKPAVIIAKTVKGKGVDFMENNPNWHYSGLTEKEYSNAKTLLAKNYGE